MKIPKLTATEASRVLSVIQSIEDIPDGHSMFVDLNDAADCDQAISEIEIDGQGYVDFARELLAAHSRHQNSKADRALQALRNPEVSQFVAEGLIRMGREYIVRRRWLSLRKG